MFHSPVILLFVKHCYLENGLDPPNVCLCQETFTFIWSNTSWVILIHFISCSVSYLKNFLFSVYVYINIFTANVHFDISIRDIKYYSRLEGSFQFNFIYCKYLEEGKDMAFGSWSSFRFSLFTFRITKSTLWLVRYSKYGNMLINLCSKFQIKFFF